MKISIVIPAYNEETYLADCLQHIVNQEDPADEIIVVDNNSTDKTSEIARSFPGVRVVSEKTQGIAYARNAGFNAAQYDVILRTDSDTEVPRDWVKRVRERFSSHNIDGLAGNAYFYDLPVFNTPFWGSFLHRYLQLHFFGKLMMYGPNMAITKRMWEIIKPELVMDGSKVHEDFDVAIKIQKHGGRILRDDTLVVPISGRRIKKDPASFFIGYSIKNISTVLNS